MIPDDQKVNIFKVNLGRDLFGFLKRGRINDDDNIYLIPFHT